MRKLTIKEFEEEIKEVHPKENLKVIQYNGKNNDAVCECLNCHSVYTKKGNYFTDKRKVNICKVCFPCQPGTFRENYIPPCGYALMEPYQGAHTKILVKHLECGFIWKVKPNNLNHGKGCPKCSKKFSKGERKIINFLNNHNIQYIFQYSLKIDNHNFIMDFYLPELNLYIEYNGEQHYHPVEFFGGEEKFKCQCLNDNLKKEKLKDSLLVISYLQFDEIEKILESSTTIRKEQAQASRSGSYL